MTSRADHVDARVSRRVLGPAFRRQRTPRRIRGGPDRRPGIARTRRIDRLEDSPSGFGRGPRCTARFRPRRDRLRRGCDRGRRRSRMLTIAHGAERMRMMAMAWLLVAGVTSFDSTAQPFSAMSVAQLLGYYRGMQRLSAFMVGMVSGVLAVAQAQTPPSRATAGLTAVEGLRVGHHTLGRTADGLHRDPRGRRRGRRRVADGRRTRHS